MTIATLIVRLFFGLAFVVFGLNAFLHFMPMPELPKNAMGDFMNALFRSGYIYAIGFCQVLGGLLLLLGRFGRSRSAAVIAPVIVNILLFHIFLDRTGLGVALVVLALWLFLVWSYRSAFAGLFQT